MFMLLFSILISAMFSGALLWYLDRFLSDIKSEDAQISPWVIIVISLILGVLNGFSVYFGWVAYFVTLAAVFAVAQLLMVENRSKLAFYLLITGQIPAAVFTIYQNIRAGQWNWLDWVFSLLLLPLIEIAAYKLASFISAESDKS